MVVQCSAVGLKVKLGHNLDLHTVEEQMHASFRQNLRRTKIASGRAHRAQILELEGPAPRAMATSASGSSQTQACKLWTKTATLSQDMATLLETRSKPQNQ